MRATAPVFPPAANGAISLIGRFCHLPRARARAAQTRMAAERGCFILSHVETARSKDRKRGRTSEPPLSCSALVLQLIPPTVHQSATEASIMSNSGVLD